MAPLDTFGKIAAAQLAFFAAAFLPAQFVLFKHGLKGIFGWIFIAIFCVVRIVGDAIVISDESSGKPISEAGLIISSVALAPLIFACQGIARESAGSLQAYRSFLFGFVPDIFEHVTTIGAIVLMIIGFINLEGDNSASDKKTGLDLIRAGGCVLLLVWIVMTAILVVSFTYKRALRAERQLAGSLAVAQIFLLVRILYVVVAAFINSASFNIIGGGTTAEHVVLAVVTEFAIVIILLTAGFMSRHLKYEEEAYGRSKDRRDRSPVVEEVGNYPKQRF